MTSKESTYQISFKLSLVQENLYDFCHRLETDMDNLKANLTDTQLQLNHHLSAVLPAPLSSNDAKGSKSDLNEINYKSDDLSSHQHNNEIEKSLVFEDLSFLITKLGTMIKDTRIDIFSTLASQFDKAEIKATESLSGVATILKTVIQTLEDSHSTFLTHVIDCITRLDELDISLSHLNPSMIRFIPYVKAQVLIYDDIFEEKIYEQIESIHSILAYVQDCLELQVQSKPAESQPCSHPFWSPVEKLEE